MVFRFPLDDAKYGPLRLAGVFELRHDAHWWLRSEEAYSTLAIPFGEDREGGKKMFGAIPFNALRESADQPGGFHHGDVSRLWWSRGIDWSLHPQFRS